MREFLTQMLSTRGPSGSGGGAASPRLAGGGEGGGLVWSATCLCKKSTSPASSAWPPSAATSARTSACSSTSTPRVYAKEPQRSMWSTAYLQGTVAKGAHVGGTEGGKMF